MPLPLNIPSGLNDLPGLPVDVTGVVNVTVVVDVTIVVVVVDVVVVEVVVSVFAGGFLLF